MDQIRGRQRNNAAHLFYELGRSHRWYEVFLGARVHSGGLFSIGCVYSEDPARFLGEKNDTRSIIYVR